MAPVRLWAECLNQECAWGVRRGHRGRAIHGICVGASPPAAPYRPELPSPTVPVAGLALVALAALFVWGFSLFANQRDGGNGDGGSKPGRPVAVIALVVVLGAALLARFSIVAWDMKPGFDIYFIPEA